MKLGGLLNEAGEDWQEGAALIVAAGLLASLGLAATYALLSILLPVLGADDSQAMIWAGATGLIWYPLAAGRVSRYFRRRGLFGNTAANTAGGSAGLR